MNFQEAFFDELEKIALFGSSIKSLQRKADEASKAQGQAITDMNAFQDRMDSIESSKLTPEQRVARSAEYKRLNQAVKDTGSARLLAEDKLYTAKQNMPKPKPPKAAPKSAPAFTTASKIPKSAPVPSSIPKIPEAITTTHGGSPARVARKLKAWHIAAPAAALGAAGLGYGAYKHWRNRERSGKT